MVTAGLGYTVSQASHVSSESTHAADISPMTLDTELTILPNDPSVNGRSFHPKLTAGSKKADSGDAGYFRKDQNTRDTMDFLFPALTLLSGAVLTAAGAIALMHRWRGIGTV